MSCEPPRRLEIGSRSVMPSPSPIRGSPAADRCYVVVAASCRTASPSTRHHVLAVVAQTRAVVPYLESDAQRSGLEALAVSGRDLGELRGLAVDVDLLDVRTGPDRQPVAVARVDPRQRLRSERSCQRTPRIRRSHPLSSRVVLWCIEVTFMSTGTPPWPLSTPEWGIPPCRHKRTARRARPPASRRHDPQP